MEFPKKELETLWCPWRVEYFEKEKPNADFLEAAARASDDAAHLVITRRKNAFLMMNRYPYAVGHLMAVPYRKTADLSSLGENEIVELWNLVAHAQALLRAATKAQGFNVGINLGECAGAGVVDYLHIHIVPRWSGDTNFMPILSGTRMLSEALRALYDKLMDAQSKIDAESRREDMNGWVEAPPPRKGLGCFARGCLILVVFGIVLAFACLAGLYWGIQRHSAIVHGIYWLAKTHSISEAPAPVPQFAASDEQIQATQERWQDFEQKARAGQPAEIELTADDINTLIAANRDARWKAFVSIAGNRLRIQASVPLGEFLGRSGYYFNGDIMVAIEWFTNLWNIRN